MAALRASVIAWLLLGCSATPRGATAAPEPITAAPMTDAPSPVTEEPDAPSLPPSPEGPDPRCDDGCVVSGLCTFSNSKEKCVASRDSDCKKSTFCVAAG